LSICDSLVVGQRSGYFGVRDIAFALKPLILARKSANLRRCLVSTMSNLTDWRLQSVMVLDLTSPSHTRSMAEA
jgi:hypothetical protein